MTTIVLCGRPSACCPVVNIERDNITITDDYGGKVVLTKDQFVMLKDVDEDYSGSTVI